MLVEMARRKHIDLKAISMVEMVSACLENLHELVRVEEKADQLLLAADLVAMKTRLRLRDGVDAPVELRRILTMTLAEVPEAFGDRLKELDVWTELFTWAGRSTRGRGGSARSQAAASFVAALEMAREGRVAIRQSEMMGDVGVMRVEVM